jgi:hypothetical protein
MNRWILTGNITSARRRFAAPPAAAGRPAHPHRRQRPQAHPAPGGPICTEWNGVYIPPQTFAERCELLDELLVANGRQPSDVRRSLMTGLVFGKDQADFDAKMAQRTLSAD